MESTLVKEISCEGSADHREVFLTGMRCSACDRVAFPRQAYGCEQCGGTEGLEALDIPAKGVIVASALVHLHVRPEPAVPFAVASVRLDAGPMVRAILGELGLKPGARVKGVIEPATHVEKGLKAALRFARAES
ncbi:Zn-ribbon domain-containing OB-fold protein [Ferrovibrio sp.]|uniref:Zn-ribbon domain-containing OB-fold protein n=1 Tax=Ferrovibrio sp. TaxID=1917215 RepID=UPI003D096992